MNPGASSFTPGGTGTEFMKFPLAQFFAPLASLRKLNKSGSINKKFVLQNSDDADAILEKYCPSARD